MLKHILPLVPSHRLYTEAFAGGAALFFAKEPCEIEVINDINLNLINFYRILKSDFKGLKIRIESTLHSRATFDFAGWVYDNPLYFEPIERAWAVWVLSKIGFASKLNGSFGYDRNENCICKKLINAKDSFTESLRKRLENTQIECTSAFHIISSRDSDHTFHFVDPPYIDTNCGHYSDTFNIADFERLLELLSTVKGKFMLTMFPHPILSEYITERSWKMIKVERTISASKTNRRKQIEIIVMNY